MSLLKLLYEYTSKQKSQILSSNNFTISLEIEANYPEMDEETILSKILDNVENSLDGAYKDTLDKDTLKAIVEIDDLYEYFEEFDKEDILNKKVDPHEIYNRIEAWLRDLHLDYEVMELFEEWEIFGLSNWKELSDDYIFYDGRLSELEELDNIEFDKDGDYTLEIRNDRYFNTIDDAIEFYETVTDHLTWEGIFMLDEWTSAHVNMGIKGKRVYNVIKLALFSNDDFASKDLRQSDFASEMLRPHVHDMIRSVIKINDKDDISNIDLTKKIFKLIIDDQDVFDIGMIDDLAHLDKKLGINIRKLEQDYIEFRFPSSDEDPETIKERMIYYGHLTKLCFDEEYMKKEYWRRLFKTVYQIVQDTRED